MSKAKLEVRFDWSLYGPTIQSIRTGTQKTITRKQYDELIEAGAFERNEITAQVFITGAAWSRL